MCIDYILQETSKIEIATLSSESYCHKCYKYNIIFQTDAIAMLHDKITGHSCAQIKTVA